MGTRQLERANDWRVVTIREVNPGTGHIEARDQYDTPLRLDITNRPPILQLPAPGEVWTIRRRGSDWLLETRYDPDGLLIPFNTMNAGDGRWWAPGAIYIDGTPVTIKGDLNVGGNLDVDGNLTVSGTVPSATPTGPAGGDLSGSYPNPQIAAGTIVDADVSGTAGIAYTKLSLTGDIVNADVNASAAITPDKLALLAASFPCTSTVTFTTETDVTGCTWTASATGTYLIIATMDISFPSNTTSDIAVGLLSVNGSNQTATVIKKDDNTASGPRGNVGQSWIVTISSGQVMKLRIRRAGSTGTAQVLSPHTTMTVVRVG